MIRLLFMMISVLAISIVSCELVGLGFLWQQGHLAPEKLKELRAVFAGTSSTAEPVPETLTSEEQESLADIRKKRFLRAIELQNRENELNLLKNTTSQTANQLISERQAFDEMKRKFQDELTAVREKAITEATEQSQTVLLALPPDSASDYLMQLSLDENVTLLKGMPESSIAKILQSFTASPAKADRGHKIFAALAAGQPERELAERTEQANRTSP